MDDGDQPPADQLPKLATPAFASRVHLEPVAQTNYLTLDTRIPPFNNLDARRAVNYAIDRNAVVKLFGGPAVAQATCQVLPPHFFAYKPYCPYTANPGPGGAGTWKAPDMAKARQLIAASHTAGDKVTVDMINSPPFNQLGVYVQTLFNQLGYHTTLHLLSHGVIYPTVGNSKNNVGATEIFWIADFPAAEDFFTNTLTCASFLPNSDANLNISQFCNHGLDTEINHALVVQRTSTTEANQLWTQVDHAATNLAPQVSLVNPRYVELTSSRVGHFIFNPLGYGLMDQMWVR
jgi:peptide/nickel transport system substrate-binding protein